MPMPASLYVLRHGIAEPHGTPGVADDERPLTAKGVSRLKEITAGLERLDLSIQKVATSPLPRALHTAEIVAKGLGLGDGPELCDVLRPETPPRLIREWLEGRTEGRLMIVGHNPSLTQLIALLLGLSLPIPPFELKKGGTAALAAEAQGGYRLDWLATPGLFRRLVN